MSEYDEGFYDPDAFQRLPDKGSRCFIVILLKRVSQ